MTNTKQLREEILDILDKHAEARHSIESDLWYEVNAKSLNEVIEEIISKWHTHEQEVRQKLAETLMNMETTDEILNYCDKIIYPESYEALSQQSDKEQK